MNGETRNDRAARRLFRDRLRGSKRKFEVMAEAREWLPPHLFSESIAWVMNQSELGSMIFFSRFPPTLWHLGRFAPLTPTSIRREILWADAFLLHQSEQLNEFIILRAELEGLIYSGSEKASFEILARIEETFGISFWLAKVRIAALQLYRGIEAQKNYTAALKGQAGRRSIQAYIVHHVSVRNEPSVTPARYESQMASELGGLALAEEWKTKTRYHILGADSIGLTDAITVLRHAHAESVIDYYEAYMLACRLAYVEGEPSITQDIAKSLLRITSKIRDPRLTAIRSRIVGASDIVIVGGDAYSPVLAGQFEQAAKRIRSEIHEYATNPALYVAAAQCTVPPILPETPSGRLAAQLRTILTKTGNVEQSSSEIERQALNFPGFDFLGVLKSIARRELSPIPPDVSIPLRPQSQAEFDRINRLMLYSVAGYLELSPAALRFIDAESRVALVSTASCDKESSACGAYVGAVLDGRPSAPLCGAECTLLSGIGAIRRREFGEAARHLEELLSENNPYYRYSAVRSLAFAYLEDAQFDRSVRLIAAEYVTNEHARHILPVRELADRLDRQARRSIESSMCLAIVYDIYARFVDGAYDAQRRTAVAVALRKADVSIPSELRSPPAGESLHQLVYFLRHVCIPEVIYGLGVFDNSEALLRERIATLETLKDLDPSSSVEYDGEIVEITRRILIQARRAQIEQSKIQLDPEGFLREATRVAREGYERYLDYRRAGLESRTQDTVPIHGTGSRDAEGAPLLARALPADEVSALFQAIVVDLRDSFVGNRYYGLEGFLSTRIRHSVLENELRSPLVGVHLVTAKDSAGNYRRNEFWRERCTWSEEVDDWYDDVNSNLAEFAGKYDSLIEEIRDQWVRVRQTDPDSGVIDLRIGQITLIRIEELIASLGYPFDTFAVGVFTLFVQLLEPGLAEIRSRLQTTARDRALEMVGELEASLNELGAAERIPDLLSAVRDVRAAIGRTLDRVESWFKVSYDTATEPLSIRDVVEISRDIARHFNPHFGAVLTLDGLEDVMIPGALATTYTDILLMLFDNVMRHGGLGNNPEVELQVQRRDDRMQLTALNALGSDADRSMIASRSASIVADIGNGSYRSALKTKSGTGLFRIHALIVDSLRQNSQLSAGINDEGRYSVSITLPLGITM